MIRFDKPAEMWEEALPIGNGRLGAMVYGNPSSEKLQLNEDSMFYGAPLDRMNQNAAANLEKVRKLITDGQIAEAERLLKLAFSSIPAQGRPYQPLGELHLTLRHEGDVSHYMRQLSLGTAIHTTSFICGDTRFTYEAFASQPDNVIALRVSSDRYGAISFNAGLTRGGFSDYIGVEQEDTVVLGGTLGHGGLAYAMMMRILTDHGQTRILGEHITVENADSAIILLTGATTWYADDPKSACREALNKAGSILWDQLKRRHVSDYRLLYDRVALELPETARDIVTYFNYGRYLLISCSRPGTLPANLQGVWNPHMDPPWASRYTININTQMNYWPAESCNLSECHTPLFEFTKRLIQNGRRVAKEMYACRGSVAHHNGDLWNDALPYDHYTPATIWVMGSAWLSLHMWAHYEYSQDQAFLREYYPYMRESALFFEDFLTEVDGYLVTNPTVSPENGYLLPNGQSGWVCAGCAMDNAILRDLFTACINASELLSEPESDRSHMKNLLTRIAPLQVGKHGQIMEWMQDYDEIEPGHRHISQLYALHPSRQITPDETPELAKAAFATISRRLSNGGGHTGWSRAWIANMYARLWMGDEALEHLELLLDKSTLPNWLDNHPPFQIDGNFGGTACVAEMLAQGRSEKIFLLPALPKRWYQGSVTGLRLPGGLTVSIIWADGHLIEAKITAGTAKKISVYYNDRKWDLALLAGETVVLAY